MEAVLYHRTVTAAGVAGTMAFFTVPVVRHIVHFGAVLVPATHKFVRAVTTATQEAAGTIYEHLRPEAESAASPSALAPKSWIQTYLHSFIHWLQVTRPSQVILGLNSLLAYCGFYGGLRGMLEYLATVWVLIFTVTQTSRALWRIPKGVWHVFFPPTNPKGRPAADHLGSIARSLQLIARGSPANDVYTSMYWFCTHLAGPISYVYILFVVGHMLASWVLLLVKLFIAVIPFLILLALLGLALLMACNILEAIAFVGSNNVLY